MHKRRDTFGTPWCLLPALCSPRGAQHLSFLSSLWPHVSFSLEKLSPWVHAPFGSSFLLSFQQEATSLVKLASFPPQGEAAERRLPCALVLCPGSPVADLCPPFFHPASLEVSFFPAFLDQDWPSNRQRAAAPSSCAHNPSYSRIGSTLQDGVLQVGHQNPHSILAGLRGCDRMKGR